ncbi:MAG: hypothetical protein K6A44_03565 [bacterium]|nr:hypothetical protein [bacterium]
MNISQINNTNFSSDELNYTKKAQTATEQEYDTSTPEISIDSADEDGEVVLSKAGSNFDGTSSRASILAEFGDMKTFDNMLDLVCCAGMAAIDLSVDVESSGYKAYKAHIEVSQMQDNTAINPGVTNLEADENSTVADIMSFTSPERVKNMYREAGSNYIDYLELLYKYELLGNKLKSTTGEVEKQKIKDALNCILISMRDFRFG